MSLTLRQRFDEIEKSYSLATSTRTTRTIWSNGQHETILVDREDELDTFRYLCKRLYEWSLTVQVPSIDED